MGILGTFKGTAWDYQQEDADKAVKYNGLMLGHKTGLGKTFISLLASCKVGGSRILITGTKSSLSVWLTEIPRWTEAEVILLSASDPELSRKWIEATNKRNPGVWLINHTMFWKLMSETSGRPYWDIVIEDEAHKSKNRKTNLFSALKRADSDFRLLLSATLASRGAQDMWAHLNQLAPKEFTSYWRFVNHFCWVNSGPFGDEVEGTRNKEELRDLLKRFYTTRKYSEVKAQMPPLRRQLIELDMDNEQERIYRKLEKDMMIEASSGVLLLSSGRLARDTRLRQIASCPKAVDPSFPLGAGVSYLLDDIPPKDSHVVVFSISLKLLQVVKTELEARGVNCFLLRGGMEPEEVVAEINRFKLSRGTMLCTISFAQSFALDTVDRAYVLGIDPDPINDIQAEGRLRRGDSIIKPEGILVKYLIAKNTKEEEFKDIVNKKVGNVNRFLEGFSTD